MEKQARRLAEGVANLGRGDDDAERNAVAHGLAQGDDVRLRAVGFEAPHMGTVAAEAELDFVGDEHPTRRPDLFGD